LADTPHSSTAPDTLSTGIDRLDTVLGGGLTARRLYMVEGLPGTGKTTLGMQFLLAGAKRGEAVMYITLSETEEEIRAVALSHGWDLSGIDILEVMPDEDALMPSEQYTVFDPDEVELGETNRTILREVEQRQPSRVVFDSLSELRLLAGSPLRYRHQVLGLKQYFGARGCTVLMLDDRGSGRSQDPQLQSLAHGVLSLEQWYPAFGRERRRLRVVKYRGHHFQDGYHDFRIARGGLEVFPRLVAASSRQPIEPGSLMSNVPGLDALLGGGLERGTSTLVTGAAGTGKSTIACAFAAAAAERGDRAALFLFDESVPTLRKRMNGLGFPLDAHLASGRISVQQVDPAELSPGEFAHVVLKAARGGARVVVIDSLNGYLNAMPDEKFLNVQLHELLTALGQLGTCTLLINVQQGLVGAHMTSPVDASYLADTVLLLRYFEAQGEVRQIVSVLKKRSGYHERALREFTITSDGLRVGEPLRRFHGLLTGVPVYADMAAPLGEDGP
jgi:circadian clock protein KaiC